MDAVGLSIVIDTLPVLAAAPQVLLAVRVYVPVTGAAMIGFCWLDVNPPGPVQFQWVAPVALPDSINVVPGHSVVRLAVAVTAVGMVLAFTTTLVPADAVHALAAVTVTL